MPYRHVDCVITLFRRALPLRHASNSVLPRRLATRWMYWTAIWADLVLRFNWLYSFIPPGLTFGLLPATLPLYLTTFVLAAEMLRRTMWGFFRLEHEQLEHLGPPEAINSLGALGGDLEKVRCRHLPCFYIPDLLCSYFLLF